MENCYLVRQAEKTTPWKTVICSTNKYTFLENDYLFGVHIKPPGKVQKKVSVFGNYNKVLLEIGICSEANKSALIEKSASIMVNT